MWSIIVGAIIIVILIIALVAICGRVNQNQQQIWYLAKCSSSVKKRGCSEKETCKPKKKTTKCCKPTTSFRIGTTFPECNVCPGDIFYNTATQSTFIFSGGEWVLLPLTNYAEFYALLPPDNQTDLTVVTPSLTTSMLFPGQQVAFPQTGLSSSSSSTSPNISRVSSTQFQLAPGAQYKIQAYVPTDIDLLASVGTFAGVNYEWVTVLPGDAAYYMIVNGNFVAATTTTNPPFLFFDGKNFPSVSDHLWFSNADETPVIQLQITRLRDAIIALVPTATPIGPSLNGVVLTPGVYATAAATDLTLSEGFSMTFDGDGYYYIIVTDGDLILNGTMQLINGAKASKIFWLRAPLLGNTIIGFLGGAPTTTSVITQGTIIDNNSIIIGSGAAHTLNGGLFAFQSISVLSPVTGEVFQLTINSASDTDGYAGNQIVLRVNGAEQSATRVGQSNAGELILQTTVSTVSASGPTTVDVSVPLLRSDPLQLFRYITGSTAQVTARLIIEQIPL